MTIFVLRMISSWQNRGSTVKEENGEVKKKENKKIRKKTRKQINKLTNWIHWKNETNFVIYLVSCLVWIANYIEWRTFIEWLRWIRWERLIHT